MSTAYIIIAGTGSYSDRKERPVRVFLNKEKAQAEMAKLEAVYKKYFPIGPDGTWEIRWDKYQEAITASALEYKALGYDLESETNDQFDWELAEAPLCDS